MEGAIAAGTYDGGVETLIAESFEIVERRTVYTHAATGAETRSYRVRRKDRNRPLGLDEAHRIALRHHGALVVKDRKSVVEGKSVAVRVDRGGRRSIKKKKTNKVKYRARESVRREREVSEIITSVQQKTATNT